MGSAAEDLTQSAQSQERREPLVQTAGVGQNMVSLWDVLTLVCCAMPIGGAAASAKIARVGFAGYALAVTVGLALGVCCALAMRVVGKIVATHIKRHPGPLQERYFRALYFAAMLWIVVALFLGGWGSSALLRLVF
jgi:hypothetical protein